MVLSLIYLLLYIIQLISAADTIYSGQSLMFGQTLTARGGNFELGFFNPGKAPNFYLGIWYKKISVQNKTFVWVANRNKPVNQYVTYSELRLQEDGNLVLLDQSNVAVWSANSTSTGKNSYEAVLMDDGNFVLRNAIRPYEVFWQSFDHPTDTFLPGGKIGYNHKTNKSQLLTSWKDSEDPAEGIYSLQLDPNRNQFVIGLNPYTTYWTSGEWNGQIFTAVPEMRTSYIFNYSYVENENESYFTYSLYNTSIFSRCVLDLSGQIKQFLWNEDSKQWFLFWSQPRKQCDVYAFCGDFGICDPDSLPYCNCMKGFRPQYPENWNKLSYSGGCKRNTALQCGKKGGFLVKLNVRLPVNPRSLRVASADDCKSACENNCDCSAYAYSTGCSFWEGALSNVQQLLEGEEGGGSLYLRLATSELGNSGGKKKTWIIVGVIATVLVLGLTVSYIWWKKWTNIQDNIIIKNTASGNDIQLKNLDLPVFELDTIATATNNFSLSNKIGQGGFGPVYKGVLPTGEEIAIKRLSRDSSQGLKEFMTEVAVIAKLQHRNLVKLLGCCIQGEERMLIYEYMRNKSLDYFIFDKRRSGILCWKKRMDIIVGIARGLLYLHRDSRLRIIHRDLKASNVLLDGKMNPKISDFGMARIMGGDQMEENTKRIAGTYGYMSPEYAADGLFSTKSDVFSFGVLVLEIVNGKRNRLFHHADHDLNLLGHAWKLLNDRKAMELMDASMKGSFTSSEVLKYIQVGLLCVQTFPKDRPAMSYVLSMLDSNGAMLPWPKQPGFYIERSPFEGDSSSTQDTALTGIEITVTMEEGR